MTKKDEKEARVAKNKIDAYAKKVRTLVGYVGPRVSIEMIVAAIAAEKTAEAYAFELASLEPVGKAVFPIKAEAVKDAGDRARQRVAAMTTKLEAANWNIDAAAPRPNYNAFNYKSACAVRANFARITKTVSSPKWNDQKGTPTIVEIDPEGVARFVANVERDAADYYDAFTCKLVAKVGVCATAELQGDSVWSNSIMIVTKSIGTDAFKIERWHTQQIANWSVYGKYFPQWPTRLLSGGA